MSQLHFCLNKLGRDDIGIIRYFSQADCDAARNFTPCKRKVSSTNQLKSSLQAIIMSGGAMKPQNHSSTIKISSTKQARPVRWARYRIHFIALSVLFSLSCQFLFPIEETDIPISATPTIEEVSPTPKNTPNRIHPKDGMEMVLIPAGNFMMGSEDGEENEKPPHIVKLDAYWIDKTEVTVAMYARCVEDGACAKVRGDGVFIPIDPFADPEMNNHPLGYINWEDAQIYCSWAGRRLPTEAEWEKAARGTDGRMYPWGNSSPEPNLLNFQNSQGGPTTIGNYPLGASPYGVLDMAGNAKEWVADWYDPDYYHYSHPFNPQGISHGVYKVIRGGGYFDDAYEVRTTFRYSADPDFNRSLDIGFRCAADENLFPQAREMYPVQPELSVWKDSLLSFLRD